MMPFSMGHIRSGGRHRRLFSGTVRSSASFLRLRRPSRIARSGAPSGLGIANPAAEASFLLQFLDVDDLRGDKNSGGAG